MTLSPAYGSSNLFQGGELELSATSGPIFTTPDTDNVIVNGTFDVNLHNVALARKSITIVCESGVGKLIGFGGQTVVGQAFLNVVAGTSRTLVRNDAGTGWIVK